MPQRYEVRGIKFFSTSNNMAMSHSCTFVISLRLPSGSYWVRHCLFMDDTAYSFHMRPGDNESVVAKGAGLPLSYLTSDATWPKELLEPQNKDVLRSKAKLKYIRKKGEKKVLVKIDVWAKKFQSLQFNLLEENAPSSDETFEMDGKVRAGFEGRFGEEDQSLERQPWGRPFDYRFTPS